MSNSYLLTQISAKGQRLELDIKARVQSCTYRLVPTVHVSPWEHQPLQVETFQFVQKGIHIFRGERPITILSDVEVPWFQPAGYILPSITY